MNKGKFIIFEGMDFSGKTTCLKLLVEILNERGIEHITTREPGGTPEGEMIRDILVNQPGLNSNERALLFQASRSLHCRGVIEPALASGKWVISDRYIISSLVHQHEAERLITSTTPRLNLTKPDYMVYTSCGLEETLRRKGLRNDCNQLDDEHVAKYHHHSGLLDYYACLLEDITLKLDTNESLDQIKLHLRGFVDKILGE